MNTNWLLSCGLLLIAMNIAACRDIEPEDGLEFGLRSGVSNPTDTPLASIQPVLPNDAVDLSATTPAQISLPTPTLVVPDEKENSNLWPGNQMPVFLEITQTIKMRGISAQSPTIGVGSADYGFESASSTLLLRSATELESATELFIGMKTILQTPDQVYEKKELIQYPTGQPVLIQVVSVDAGRGILGIDYQGETFKLSPGESRTFKQEGDNTNASTVITILVNYGSLADIKLSESNDSWR